MRLPKMIHYLLSAFAGMVSFVLGYGLLQVSVTRNLPVDTALQLLTVFIINFSVAGFFSGAVYAASFKRGYLRISIIPAALFGGFWLVLAMIRGEIAIGVEYIVALTPWQFAIPVVLGIASSYFGAKVMRWFLLPKMKT
jgi:hypothetical protein